MPNFKKADGHLKKMNEDNLVAHDGVNLDTFKSIDKSEASRI